MADLIALSEFSFRYPHSTRDALHSVSLSVKSGEVIVVAGGDESGRTTLCYALAGYCTSLVKGTCCGAVQLDGKEFGSWTLAEILERTALVMQNPRNQLSNATATVLEELAFTAENLGWEPARIRTQLSQVAEKTNITHLLNRCPMRLSGGETQLVMIAAALMVDPRVLILDEPLSQLDPATAAMVLSLLKDLAGQGKAIVLATNNLSITLEAASRIIVLEEGSLVLDDLPAVVIGNLVENDRGIVLPTGHRLAKQLKIYAECSNGDIPVSHVMLLERFRLWLSS